MPTLNLGPGVHHLEPIETEETVVIQARDCTIHGLDVRSTTTGEDAKPATPGRARNHPRARAHVLFHPDCRRVRVIEPRVWGPHTEGGSDDDGYLAKYEAQHAYEISGGEDVQLIRPWAREVFGDFVYLGGDTLRPVVADYDFARNGRQGIAITEARQVRLLDGIMAGVRRACFDLEPGKGRVVDGVLIRRPETWDHRLMWLAAHGAGIVHRVTIEDPFDHDTLSINVKSSPAGRRRSWKVRGAVGLNPYGSPGGAAFVFRGVDYLSVSDCQVALQARRPKGQPAMRLLLPDGCRWVRSPAEYLTP